MNDGWPARPQPKKKPCSIYICPFPSKVTLGSFRVQQIGEGICIPCKTNKTEHQRFKPNHRTVLESYPTCEGVMGRPISPFLQAKVLHRGQNNLPSPFLKCAVSVLYGSSGTLARWECLIPLSKSKIKLKLNCSRPKLRE